MARWLLIVSDLTQSNNLLLTQEFLSQMLGVRRAGITLTAQTFQRAGVITYRRGKIIILSREALEDISECYQLFHYNYYRQWFISSHE